MFMLSSERHMNVICTFNLNFVSITEVYSEPCKTSKMGLFAKTINGFQLLTIFVKNSILDVWLGSEYSFALGAEGSHLHAKRSIFLWNSCKSRITLLTLITGISILTFTLFFPCYLFWRIFRYILSWLHTDIINRSFSVFKVCCSNFYRG